MESRDATETVASAMGAADVSNAEIAPMKKRRKERTREKKNKSEYNTRTHGDYSGGGAPTKQVVNLAIVASASGGSWKMLINQRPVGLLNEPELKAFVQGGALPLPNGCTLGDKLKDNRSSVIFSGGKTLAVGFFYLEELRNDVGKLFGMDAVPAASKKKKKPRKLKYRRPA